MFRLGCFGFCFTTQHFSSRGVVFFFTSRTADGEQICEGRILFGIDFIVTGSTVDLFFIEVRVRRHCNDAGGGTPVIKRFNSVGRLHIQRLNFSIFGATFTRALLFADYIMFNIFFRITVLAHFHSDDGSFEATREFRGVRLFTWFFDTTWNRQGDLRLLCLLGVPSKTDLRPPQLFNLPNVAPRQSRGRGGASPNADPESTAVRVLVIVLP